MRSKHETLMRKDVVREFGWSERMTRRFLPEPDEVEVGQDRYKRKRFRWRRETIEALMERPEVAQELSEALERRAKRMMREAQEMLVRSGELRFSLKAKN